MITRTPLTRHNLKIKSKDRVLEVGSGHNPMYRSNVLAEKFAVDNAQRSGDVHIYPHQTFVEAEGENLPFADNAFDYIICNQVLEHAVDPVRFIKEITRVGKRGYIETPSLVGELLFPKKSHKWAILYIDNKLVFYEKAKMPGNYRNDYGELFLNYLPYQSLPYKLLNSSEVNLLINRIEWKEGIDFLVNPQDPRYKPYFTQKWTREMTTRIYPPRSVWTEMGHTIQSAYAVVVEKIMRMVNEHRKTISLEDYLKSQL